MALAVNYIPALSAKAVILPITSSAPLQLAVLQRRVRLLEKRRRRRCPPTWVMPLWEKMPDIFLSFPTWKSVEAELPVQKLPRNIRKGLLSECIILPNMQNQKALIPRFMRQTAPPGINSMQLTRWTNLLILLRMVRLHITNLS